MNNLSSGYAEVVPLNFKISLMAYDKPKVTIDLEEYQELKRKAEEINKDELFTASKKIIGALLINGGLTQRTNEYLTKENIWLNIDHEMQYGHFKPEYINIGLIKESKEEL